MNVFYDERDQSAHELRGSRILYWLDDLGAKPLSEASSYDGGFVFTGARPIQDYQRLVARLPLLHDRPDKRAPLLGLDTVLDSLDVAGVVVPKPKTWQLRIDHPIPNDLIFPLFLRTPHSSLKLGGRISRVTNHPQLESEVAELRRLLGWDSSILAREWCHLAEAGTGMYGPVPQEVRVWIVDRIPYAWSFHYLNVLGNPAGFPPSTADLHVLEALAGRVGSVFESRLMTADFARTTNGDWVFIEAGPGSCSGTAHEFVFKSVAASLMGRRIEVPCNPVGGLFTNSAS